MPPEHGTSRDPLKLLTSIPRAILKWASSRWRRLSPASSRRWAPLSNTDDNDAEGDSGGVLVEETGLRDGVGVEGDPADFEPLRERGGEKRGVVIAGLRKEFGSKVAVAGLDLRLLPGDITCLLGHNGAGEDARARFAPFRWHVCLVVSIVPCEQVLRSPLCQGTHDPASTVSFGMCCACLCFIPCEEAFFVAPGYYSDDAVSNELCGPLFGVSGGATPWWCRVGFASMSSACCASV